MEGKKVKKNKIKKAFERDIQHISRNKKEKKI